MFLADFVYRTAASVSREPYARANLRILRTLPVIPGAKLESVAVVGYTDQVGDISMFNRTIGYDTIASYGVPAKTTAGAVIGFYARHLRGWRPAELNYRDGIADFVRGRADLSIDATMSPGPDGRPLISIDLDQLGAVQSQGY